MMLLQSLLWSRLSIITSSLVVLLRYLVNRSLHEVLGVVIEVIFSRVLLRVCVLSILVHSWGVMLLVFWVDRLLVHGIRTSCGYLWLYVWSLQLISAQTRVCISIAATIYSLDFDLRPLIGDVTAAARGEMLGLSVALHCVVGLANNLHPRHGWIWAIGIKTTSSTLVSITISLIIFVIKLVHLLTLLPLMWCLIICIWYGETLLSLVWLWIQNWLLMLLLLSKTRRPLSLGDLWVTQYLIGVRILPLLICTIILIQLTCTRLFLATHSISWLRHQVVIVLTVFLYLIGVFVLEQLLPTVVITLLLLQQLVWAPHIDSVFKACQGEALPILLSCAMNVARIILNVTGWCWDILYCWTSSIELIGGLSSTHFWVSLLAMPWIAGDLHVHLPLKRLVITDDTVVCIVILIQMILLLFTLHFSLVRPPARRMRLATILVGPCGTRLQFWILIRIAFSV